MSTNPYAAPTTHVADIVESGPEGNFNPAGRGRPAGNGWEWIKSARALTKRQIWLWIGMVIVFAILSIALGAIPLIGPVILYIFMPVLFGGVMLASDKAYKGNDIEFGDFFSGFRDHFAKLAGLGLAILVLFVVVFAVIAAVFGSAMALMLSGVEQPDTSDPAFLMTMLMAVLVMMGLSIPVYMAMWFSYSLVAINGLGIFQALKASFTGCLKNIVPFLIYGIVMTVLVIVASIPLMLGWLILGPVLSASFYTGYRDIFYED